MKKTIATILSAVFLLSPLSAMAFTSQQITANNPAVLPENPFYVFKSWTREIQNFFISNPVKKLMFNVHVLGQKGAEVAISLELSSGISETALNNYAATSIALAEKISNLTPAVIEENISLVFETSDQLIDYLLERLIVHIELHQKILKASDNEQIKLAKEALIQSIGKLGALDLDPNLSERIQMIARSQGSDFALQFIETEGNANFGS